MKELLNLFTGDLFNLNSLLDNTNTNTFKHLNLKTKEGHDEALKVLNEVKENELIKTMTNSWLGIDINSIVESLKDTVNDIYYNKEEDKTTSCEKCCKKVVDKSVEKVPEKPSTNISDNVSKRIHELTSEYMCKIVAPHSNASRSQLEDVENSLYEFACWIFNHK